MKLLTAIFFTSAMLYGAWFGTPETPPRESRLQHETVQELFRKTFSDANAVVKRGEYDRFDAYREGLADVMRQLDALQGPALQKERLSSDLREYSGLVTRVGASLRLHAPGLNKEHQDIVDGLKVFNRKLSGIGLAELLQDWRELSRIKNGFVKKPEAEMVKAFDEKWTSVTVTITELYLDDEIETPLLEFLERYKDHFRQLNAAYRHAGYENVCRLKPLGYEIKMQLQMLAGKPSAS